MKLRDYLISEDSQSKEGKDQEARYRKAQLDSAAANFYDVYMEKPERDMIREFEFSVDAAIKRMKQKGLFK